jgi:hypothetical protein
MQFQFASLHSVVRWGNWVLFWSSVALLGQSMFCILQLVLDFSKDSLVTGNIIVFTYVFIITRMCITQQNLVRNAH